MKKCGSKKGGLCKGFSPKVIDWESEVFGGQVGVLHIPGSASASAGGSSVGGLESDSASNAAKKFLFKDATERMEKIVNRARKGTLA